MWDHSDQARLRVELAKVDGDGKEDADYKPALDYADGLSSPDESKSGEASKSKSISKPEHQDLMQLKFEEMAQFFSSKDVR